MKHIIDVEELAIFMHDKYEEQAKRVGWKTQESCRVEYKDLPEKNQQVMENVALAVIGWMNKRIP